MYVCWDLQYLLSVILRPSTFIYYLFACSTLPRREMLWLYIVHQKFNDVTIYGEMYDTGWLLSYVNIFLNVFFMRPLLVPSKLVIPLSHTLGSGSGRNYPEHYHLYEILCASLCIVIIPSLFTAIPSGGACGSDENKNSSIHVYARVERRQS